jgi:O-6-methylguanine DNA methyltransferase
MKSVLELLTKIPKGKVTTYGELARAAGTSPRAVGQIMRHNSDPITYPCYKVVASDGRVHGYSGCMKGAKVNRKISLLKNDGIEISNGKIDLSRHLYKFN